MPNPKKVRKKKLDDKAQKSIFSFVDEEVTEKKEPAKEIRKEEIKDKKQGEKSKPPKTEPIEKIPSKKETPKKDLSQISNFTGNDKPFGLKLGTVKLDKVLREGVTSKYIRYLIKKGEIVENLDRGLLLDVDYDGGQNKAFCKFYDLETEEIKIWIDTTSHEPYCLSKEPISELEKLYYSNGKAKSKMKLTDYPGFKRFEEIKKFELLSDKEINMVKLYGETPTNIGGSGTNIRNILGENEKKAWEADIRYHLNYIFDTQLIPGLIYSVKNGKLERLDFEKIDDESKKMADELRVLFKDETPEIQEFSEKFLDIFITPIPDVKRLAMDIEVMVGEKDYRIPDPVLAKQDVISISFVATDGLKLVYMLEREDYSFTKLFKDFPSDAKIILFKSEKNLLIEAFRLMWEYPVVLTFNGDNFDLNYLFHRADKLKIDRDLNPIHVKRGFGILSKAECDLRSGIHIDLFNIFFNRSISGYAFGGVYESASLNTISAALLGEEKYQHEELIHEMEYDILSWYNLKDSMLTLDLTKFNNSLVWNLIILLCRITKMPIHDMVRRQISTWIQNIFYFEHRRKNSLIPRRSEISDRKKGGILSSKADNEKFMGAYVVPPVPGIHFDVVVMDFASLYPSIIKEYNLSYETVLCPHKDDEDNLVKGTPYHICTHKMGIFAYVVGFFRDIRVKYFKPKSGDKDLTEKQRSSYQTIQQALKVFINGSYGVFGSQNFPLFCLPVAESTTGIGQYSIKQTINKAEELGIKVLYGDSVTGDTPLLLRRNDTITIKRIDDLISEWINAGEKEFAFCEFEIWGEKGFTKIKRVIRHKTKKKLFRILTHIGVVDVTEDHSLLTKNKEIIKPRQVKIGTELLHAFPKEFRENPKLMLSKEEAFIYGLFYADGSAGKYNTKWSYKYSWAINNQDIRLLRKGLEILNQIEAKNGLVFKIIDTIESSAVYKLIPTGGLKEITERYRALFYDIKGQKRIPDIILNASSEIKRSFFEGYCSGDEDKWGRNKFGNIRLSNKGKIGTMGFYYLLASMGYKVSINSRLDKLDVYRLNATKSNQRKNPNAIKKIIPLGTSEDYVYDLETESHHFHAGIGQMIIHNTDSVFLLNPSKEQMKDISEWSKKELDLDLEEEKTYQFLALSDRKKNYIGIYKNTRYTDIKGLVAKKKNTPNFIKKAFSEMIDILKNITDNEEFLKARNQIIDIVKDNLKKIGKPNTFTLEDYAINIGLQKKIGSYTKVVPQHVRAAKELMEVTGKTFEKGENITFIKSKGPLGAKAIELAKLQDIDTKKYKELLTSALEQVLDALGITFDEIKGIKKMDAFF
ncbi:MAG: DNA polymerase domain-containing protein [Promethearchaeota archaeon]